VKINTDDEEKEKEKKTKKWIKRECLESTEDLMRYPRDRVRGIALGIVGQLAYPRYESERGKHIFIRKAKRQQCHVSTTEVELKDYNLPTGLERNPTFAYQEIRREYNYDKECSTDKLLNKIISWNGKVLDKLLLLFIQEKLVKEAMETLLK
jgi:hypothetical protein